ncbi:MAG: hypothetical protein IJ037_12745 [Clostridia bacterium]|nr:hypothetical protein [Clostridia bacterium]
MKKVLLCLILLLCLSLLQNQCDSSPMPDGIHMGMSAEKAAEILSGEVTGGTITTENALYVFGENGLMYIILHENR